MAEAGQQEYQVGVVGLWDAPVGQVHDYEPRRPARGPPGLQFVVAKGDAVVEADYHDWAAEVAKVRFAAVAERPVAAKL